MELLLWWQLLHQPRRGACCEGVLSEENRNLTEPHVLYLCLSRLHDLELSCREVFQNQQASKEGNLSTGNSLDITLKDEETILSNDAALKGMEGAAEAYVADILLVPLVLLKAVTDIVDVDRPRTDEFLENLSTAANALTDIFPKVLDYLSERNLSAL